ncbi:hypothetical protein [Arthrobacter sp. UM1]|uniref:hypothetical protein n=1 Tax=Arthrobacter sp. UM1 TaxID=2766776 RepID=UPI001CF6C99A|nr:hypothetical protein [Arthrobacter sp. UM1]MCB4208821.1 hypothetical protein [Arthrobacter sp. UM1]
MERRHLIFIALVISILYGVLVPVFRDTQAFVAVGAAVVAIAWVAVGLLAKRSDERCERRRNRDRNRDRIA